MIKIRLSRTGAKNKPFFRIVAIDTKRKREGKPLDVLGYWQPEKGDTRGKRAGEGKKEVDKEKLKIWIAKGARLTASVKKLLA